MYKVHIPALISRVWGFKINAKGFGLASPCSNVGFPFVQTPAFNHTWKTTPHSLKWMLDIRTMLLRLTDYEVPCCLETQSSCCPRVFIVKHHPLGTLLLSSKAGRVLGWAASDPSPHMPGWLQNTCRRTNFSQINEKFQIFYNSIFLKTKQSRKASLMHEIPLQLLTRFFRISFSNIYFFFSLKQ